MVLKKIFGGSKPKARVESVEDDGERTIEDLIVLERYDEAESRLKARLKENPDDLHLHLKLADVHTALGRREAAADGYVHVADEYGRDGFYDKGVALLNRALKMTPGEERLRLKLHALEAAKNLEYKREAAGEGLRASRHGDKGAGNRVLTLQRQWHYLAPSALMQRLSADEIRRFFSAVELVEVETGTTLVERGSKEPFMVLVLSGILAAMLPRGDESSTLLREFSVGDLLGEAATLERRAWPADLRVVEDARLLKLDRAGVQHAMAGSADPRSFLDNLRVDRNDRELAEMVAKLKKA